MLLYDKVSPTLGGLPPDGQDGGSTVAEVNCDPGRNPKAGRSVLAASQVRLGGACCPFPWGCLKRAGGLQIPGTAISSSLRLLPMTYCKQSQPPALWDCMPAFSPRKRCGNPKPFSRVDAQGASLWAFVQGSCEVSGAEQDVMIEEGFSFFPEAVAMPTG